MKIKKLSLALVLAFGISTSAMAQTFPNASWRYSVPLNIASGASVNSTVKVDVDFAALLSALGASGTFDPNSVRVVRPNGTLATIQEFNDNIYGGTTNATGNAKGQVAFILENAGPSVYQIYFDVTANGVKAANPQTPINGGFEKGTTGQSQPLGWNAPTVSANYDAQVRPSENPTITTRAQNGTLSKTVNGTPYSGDYSYLIGDRTDTSTAGVASGGVTITKTITVPNTNPGNLVFKYRIEGWDSADNAGTSYDFFKVQIISNTTANIVGPAGSNYTIYLYSPNYGTTAAANNSSGYGQYNGWDFTTGTNRKTQDGNPTMTLAKGAEPWFTVTYPLNAFAGKTITLSFSTTHQQLYKTWVSIDDVEWSVISGTLGSPIAYNLSVNAANFDCLETGTNTPFNKSARNPLYTKLTNTAFSFDIVALDSTGAIESNYVADSTSSKTVTVELFDATTANTCAGYSSPVATTTATFNKSSSGRVTIPNITSTVAYPKLVCRVKDTNPTTPVYGCSSDFFSVRPQNITSVSSSANADTTGISDTATPITKAGNNFTVNANVGVQGYGGIPKVNNSAIEWLNAPSYGVPQATSNGAGTLLGSFTNAATVSTGNGANGSFNYSEAGYFRFKSQAIYDNDFVSASADSSNNDCIVDSFSNTLINGKYGCNFGTTTASPYIGRFVPSAFVVSSNSLTNRSDLLCSATPSFTYLGEPFDLSVSLKPVNSLGQTTLNYARVRFLGTNLASWGLNVSNSLTSRVVASNYAANWDSTGVLNTVATLNISRNTNPDGPFNNSIVSINPSDLDNITLSSSALDVDTDSNSVLDSKNIGATNFYFGRIKIINTNGSELLKLAVPIEVQYFNGAGFITNTNDSCTKLINTNFTTTNFTQNLTASEISLVYPSLFVNGKQTIIMNKPSGGDGVYNGSFDLNYNLSTNSQTYLTGKWTGSTYSENPKAKIVLSRQAKNRVIFVKDNY
jgi:hypothetical protein